MFGDLVTLTDRVPRLRVIINHLPYDTAQKFRGAAKSAKALFASWGAGRKCTLKSRACCAASGGHTPTELSFYRESLDRLWENFGQNRLVYGSNWPVSNVFAPYPQCCGSYASISWAKARRRPNVTSGKIRSTLTSGSADA